MKFWKRNAVVATVVLFVCVALYLSWSYNRDELNADDYLSELTFTETQGAVSPSPGIPANDGYLDDLFYLEDDPYEPGYFTEERLNRQRARDSALTILRDLSAQENISDEERQKTNSEISNLAAQALTEAKIEGLVIAKGFADCVTYINDSTVSVVVAPPDFGLTATDVVKIKDIVVSETSFTPADIRIMEANPG